MILTNQEKRMIRYCATLFEINKPKISSAEVREEFTIDSNNCDVLLRKMESLGVVERIETTMNRGHGTFGGYKATFEALRLEREIEAELEKQNSVSPEERSAQAAERAAEAAQEGNAIAREANKIAADAKSIAYYSFLVAGIAVLASLIGIFVSLKK